MKSFAIFLLLGFCVGHASNTFQDVEEVLDNKEAPNIHGTPTLSGTNAKADIGKVLTWVKYDCIQDDRYLVDKVNRIALRQPRKLFSSEALMVAWLYHACFAPHEYFMYYQGKFGQDFTRALHNSIITEPSWGLDHCNFYKILFLSLNGFALGDEIERYLTILADDNYVDAHLLRGLINRDVTAVDHANLAGSNLTGYAYVGPLRAEFSSHPDREHLRDSAVMNGDVLMKYIKALDLIEAVEAQTGGTTVNPLGDQEDSVSREAFALLAEAGRQGHLQAQVIIHQNTHCLDSTFFGLQLSWAQEFPDLAPAAVRSCTQQRGWLDALRDELNFILIPYLMCAEYYFSLPPLDPDLSEVDQVHRAFEAYKRVLLPVMHLELQQSGRAIRLAKTYLSPAEHKIPKNTRKIYDSKKELYKRAGEWLDKYHEVLKAFYVPGFMMALYTPASQERREVLFDKIDASTTYRRFNRGPNHYISVGSDNSGLHETLRELLDPDDPTTFDMHFNLPLKPPFTTLRALLEKLVTTHPHERNKLFVTTYPTLDFHYAVRG